MFEQKLQFIYTKLNWGDNYTDCKLLYILVYRLSFENLKLRKKCRQLKLLRNFVI